MEQCYLVFQDFEVTRTDSLFLVGSGERKEESFLGRSTIDKADSEVI